MSEKILIVTDFYEPHISGIVTYINKLINSLPSKHYEITILTTRHNSKLNKFHIHNNINIIRCNPTFKISRGFFSIELIYEFFKIRKNFNYVNVHLPLVEICPIAFFLDKKKTIITYHCLPEFPFYLIFIKFYFYLFGIFSIVKSNNLVVLSKDYFNKFLFHKFLNKKLIEIPPYVDLPNLQKNLLIERNKIVIGYLGRLCEEKGLEYLVLLSNHLLSNEINHELIIAGDLNDKRFLKYINFIKNIGKGNKCINFIGKLSIEQKDEFYKNLDLFVLPSTNSFEAFGIVQLEAMSYGVPVISSNIYGVRTIIQRTKNGYIFKNKNIDDLISKFNQFRLNNLDPSLIRENLIKNYSKEIFLKKISLLFKFS